MKKIILTSLLAILLTSSGEVYGQDATIYNVDGEVSLLRSRQPVPIKADLPLRAGDIVKTDVNGALDVAFYWYMGCRFTDSAEVVIPKLNENSVSLQVKRGTVLVNVRNLPDSFDYEIETPLAVVTVKGTVQFWARTFLDKNNNSFETFALRRGILFVRLKSGSTVAIAEGTAVDVSSDESIIPSLRVLSEEETKLLEKSGTVLIPIADE